MHLESIGNSTFDVSPKRDLKNSTELQIDQSGDRHKFEQINDFDWSAINIEKIGGFKESTPLRCSEYNPVRSEIAVGSNGSCLRIFQLQNPSHSMEPILTLNKVHEASIYCCDYAFNGEYMATGSNDKGNTILQNYRPILYRLYIGPSKTVPVYKKDCTLSKNGRFIKFFSYKNYAFGLQSRVR